MHIEKKLTYSSVDIPTLALSFPCISQAGRYFVWQPGFPTSMKYASGYCFRSIVSKMSFPLFYSQCAEQSRQSFRGHYGHSSCSCGLRLCFVFKLSVLLGYQVLLNKSKKQVLGHITQSQKFYCLRMIVQCHSLKVKQMYFALLTH